MPIGQEQRRLDIQRIEGILNDVLPKPREEAVSICCYHTGYTRDRVKEIIKIIYDMKIIVKDEKENLLWNKKE